MTISSFDTPIFNTKSATKYVEKKALITRLNYFNYSSWPSSVCSCP